MRFLSIGAGAIGSYIGGSLLLAGHDVVFLERPRASTIQKITIRKGNRAETTSPFKVVTSLEETLAGDPFDAAIFAIKSFDTRAAAESFAPSKDSLPPLLCLQNGVENESILAGFLGPEKVIAGTVTTAISKDAPGSVIVEKLRGVGISDLHLISPDLEQAFEQAGLNPVLFENAPAMKWSKLLTNLLANATSAILAMTPEEVFSDQKLFRVEIAQLRETLAVMGALKLPVVDLPGTPVRLLAMAIRTLPLPVLQPLLRKAVIGGRGGKMPSFYIDMMAGQQRSEVEFLNGAVVRFGLRTGVPTPINRFLAETLSGMATGEIQKDTFQKKSAAFLSALGK